MSLYCAALCRCRTTCLRHVPCATSTIASRLDRHSRCCNTSAAAEYAPTAIPKPIPANSLIALDSQCRTRCYRFGAAACSKQDIGRKTTIERCAARQRSQTEASRFLHARSVDLPNFFGSLVCRFSRGAQGCGALKSRYPRRCFSGAKARWRREAGKRRPLVWLGVCGGWWHFSSGGGSKAGMEHVRLTGGATSCIYARLEAGGGSETSRCPRRRRNQGL